jgi:hypothetical protein
MSNTYVARIGSAGLVALLLGAGAHLVAQNGTQFASWKPGALADAVRLKPRAACPSLVALTGYEVAVISATIQPATAEAPEFCRVSGLIQPEIRFEVYLPAEWNNRFYMFGNGGYAGEALGGRGRVAMALRGLSRGFAVAQTNTGHDSTTEPLGTFAASPQKFVDYAFRAVHVTAMTAKRIAQAYYGTAPRRSYFDGCSTGGRQGLISAQRFPDDFDGIVVGAPVLDFTGTMIGYVTSQRALAAAPIAPAKLKIIADAVYAKCDAMDGLADGLIDDPRRCAFRPAADLPACPGDADGPACFTAAEIKALEIVYGGTKRNGADVFPGQPVGAEIAAAGPGGPAAASGWVPWLIGAPSMQPIYASFGETFFKYMAFGRPNPNYDWLSFNVDTDLDKVQGVSSALDATDPDLSGFKARGGKIVSYFGWADPALNPLMGVRYYESVAARLGPATRDFYRLFMVPGMFHCSGGVGVSSFDALTPLIEWVEKGTAPNAIVGSRIVDGKVVRTRPLCPYPQVARYKGSGSVEEAANFACVAPEAGGEGR